MNKLFRGLIYVAPLLSVLLMFIIFNVSNPVDIGPGGILSVFVLIYVFFASSLFIVMHFGINVVAKILTAKTSITVRQWSIGVHRAYYIASAVAFAPVILLAMQSVGQLQLRDIMLVTFLEMLTIFYIVKRTS